MKKHLFILTVFLFAGLVDRYGDADARNLLAAN
jgi:hypothetical protein